MGTKGGVTVLGLVVGCSTASTGADGGTETGVASSSPSSGMAAGDTAASSDGPGGTGADSGGVDETAGDSTGAEIKFDLGRIGDAPDPGPVDVCTVLDDMNAVGECEDQAPADSFEPVEQWSYTPPGEPQSYVTPLVANLTDDNADGVIDLCDVPDVVLVAGVSTGGFDAVGHIYVLDGATGTLHFQIPQAVHGNVTPALGDIDGTGSSRS